MMVVSWGLQLLSTWDSPYCSSDLGYLTAWWLSSKVEYSGRGKDTVCRSTDHAEAVSFFMTYPQKPQSIPSFVLCWSESVTSPCPDSREGKINFSVEECQSHCKNTTWGDVYILVWPSVENTN